MTIILFGKIKKIPFFWVMDRVVIIVALSGFLIRMGNLMNSEIFGIPTRLPWGFLFIRAAMPGEIVVPRLPTQLYEGISYLLIFGYLLWYYYRKNGKPETAFIFGMFLVLIFGMRFLIEFIKLPQVGFEEHLFLNMGQLLSIPFIITGLILVVYSKGWLRKLV